METTTYFLMTAFFVAPILILASVALKSPSRGRYLAPLAVIFAFAVAYITLDAMTGSSKPYGAVPGWSYPDLVEGEVTVLGGAPFAKEGAYLMVQEEGRPPVLLRFDTVGGFQQKMKQAMERQAKQNGGNPWGFKMRKPKQGGSGSDAGQKGKGKKGEGGPPTDGNLEDRENLYVFEPPQPKSLPEKSYETERVVR